MMELLIATLGRISGSQATFLVSNFLYAIHKTGSVRHFRETTDGYFRVDEKLWVS